MTWPFENDTSVIVKKLTNRNLKADILALFGLEFLLSVWTVSRQRKQSLVEQMRR